MSSDDNEELLEEYVNGFSNIALKDAEKFLESCLPLAKGVTKERLLEKVLYEEQQIEYQRRVVKKLKEENAELTDQALNHGKKMKSVEAMKRERADLQKRRDIELSVNSTSSLKSFAKIEKQQDETEKMRAEIEKLRQRLHVVEQPGAQ